MAIKCRIWWNDAAGAYDATFAYNKSLVEGIKLLIPSGDRAYDENTGTWSVKEQYGEMLRQIAEKGFGIGSVSFTSKTVAQQSQQRTYSGGNAASLSPSAGTTEDAVVAFMNLVPYDGAKRAYLIAAQALHPDKGGDPSKMARLNELWSRLEKEFYKR